MEPKAHSLFKLIALTTFVFLLGCSKPIKEKENIVFEIVDVSQIPNTTVFENDTLLKLKNGIYYYDNKPYSGYVKSNYGSDTLKFIASYFKGKQQGKAKTFFENGKLETERNYRDGIGYGRHYGYWKNGNIKFDFVYFNDKREGIQKQWYESGSPYCELSFSDDRENGMQKAWRENGKPYINYEVKDGVRYGLQKSALCYTLKNEKLK